MFEELFNRFPGLQNLYENAVANGYTGDPEQLLKEYGQDFSQNIGGLGSMMGIQQPIGGQLVAPNPMPPLDPTMATTMPTTPAGRGVTQQAMPAQMLQPGAAMGAMPQPMPPAALPMPQTMVDPNAMAYQRGLLSGSVQPQNPYGFGLATSPYYGYPRNPYGSLLY